MLGPIGTTAAFFRADGLAVPLGYSSTGFGVGGTVTQATNKTTGVTLNTFTGRITTSNSALANVNGGNNVASFTLTNNKIAANDLLLVQQVGGPNPGAYFFNAQCAAGSAVINITNCSFFGTLGDAIVIGFMVIKGTIT